MNFYYNGVWRMDWGLGNPNKTATLIACLMIAIWAIPIMWKRGFWPVLIVFTALAWCLVQTYSRGGMVAFLAGTGVLLACTPRPWPRERWIALMASLWVVGGFVLYAKAQTRYGQGLFTPDQSINSRLIIWKHAPEMMAAAPWGWGPGKAGDAYTQWYQPISEPGFYLNLINSHFTWMVEWGWVASVLYLFCWISILILCWPEKLGQIRSVPLAIWVALGIGACFSHVEESIWLWLLPLFALAHAVWERWRTRQWPMRRSFVMSGFASMGIVTILILTGFATSSLPLSVYKGVVSIGRGSNTTGIYVDRHVLGSFYGHTFRKFLTSGHNDLSNETYVLAESTDDLQAKTMTRLVASGKFADYEQLISHLGKGKQIILVNPSASPEDPGFDKDAVTNTLVYFGEYSQTPSRSAWSSYPGVKAFQIDGASDFVPSWPQAILTPCKM